MFSSRKKISKEKGAEPDAFEESVAQVGLGTEVTERAVSPRGLQRALLAELWTEQGGGEGKWGRHRYARGRGQDA